MLHLTYPSYQPLSSIASPPLVDCPLSSTSMQSTQQIQGNRRIALRTAINPAAQVLPDEVGFDLQTLGDEYYRRFRPTTPEQRMFVDTLIDCDWLLRRFRRIERQVFEDNTGCLTVSGRETHIPDAFRKSAEVLARLQRRIDSTQRNYRNALRDLERLQAEEEVPESDPQSTSVSPTEETPNSKIGFVPHTPLSRESHAPRTAAPARPAVVISPTAAPPIAR